MVLKREGVIFLLGIAALAAVVAVLFLASATNAEPVRLVVRFFGLYGYLFLSVATLITPFLKEVTQTFGKPFLKVHHSFSIMGIVFITLHPVFNAIERLSLSVFIPNFSSWDTFWRLAGRPAFILFYIAVFAAVLRAKAPKYWRTFHALMYVVLLFGIVHANLIGTDFENFGVMLIYNALFAAALAAFALKRYRKHLMKKDAAVF
ncbi:MAG: ferric reductase-like transmembrane domain-containing protein [Candidatus Bathyarchaeia archaeon]